MAIYFHPVSNAPIVGRKIEAGEILKQSDLYDSSSGHWMPCPCPGCELGQGVTAIWVRPGEGAIDMRIRTIIETPYYGAVALHVEYLKLCLLDSLQRGEAPFASHLFYTLVLDDTKDLQRRQGMECGFAWADIADRVVVYTDMGITDGMKKGIARAESRKVEVLYRKLNEYGIGILVPRRIGE